MNGSLPDAPLFLPITFSLGAKIENVPIQKFLSNPTKICNSLRQIRTHLRADGAACYFDPLLELEAMGVALQWKTENGPVMWQWLEGTKKGQLPNGLRSPEEAVKSGRVPVAAEIIRRMNVTPQRDFLLTAGVRGPFTLAARLTQVEPQEKLSAKDLPQDALELSAAVTTQLASVFVEAGADAVFLQEDVLPALDEEDCASWASLLAPTINVIRFYEAIPVLLLTDNRTFADNREVIFGRPWECVVCVPLAEFVAGRFEKSLASKQAALGVSLPLEAFGGDEASHEDFCKTVRSAVSELKPAVLTTAGDVPLTADMKRLVRLFEAAPRSQ